MNQAIVGQGLPRFDRYAMLTWERGALGKSGRYDPLWVSQFYDAYGEREWARWDRSPEDRIKLHLHSYYLEKYIHSGARILEIGAGSGRFTQKLASLGANIVVADLSKGQLALNRINAERYGYQSNIEDWLNLDVCDLSSLPTSSFDSIVAYGGLIGFVFEHRHHALTEMLRVLKVGGALLISVMSVWGSFHSDLDFVLGVDTLENEKILASGDLHPETFSNPNQRSHMFRSEELIELLLTLPIRLEVVSASNSLTAGQGDKLAAFEKQPEKWQYLLEKEIEASKSSGCLDIGTHIIAVVLKT